MAARFDGKVTLITGAGSGMGRAITIRLASEGAALLAVDIDEDRLIETKALATGLANARIAPAGTNTNIVSSTTFPPDVDIDLVTRMAGFRGLAEPEEIAALFSFLASDEARSVTGAIYTIDNGITAN
jgi:NAD(P)-dependent dehydrogenase (short-subunit alcohol dehydrogenase family)